MASFTLLTPSYGASGLKAVLWISLGVTALFVFITSEPFLAADYWGHLGDVFAAVGLIAFTLASLLIVDLGLNWRELTTRRA